MSEDKKEGKITQEQVQIVEEMSKRYLDECQELAVKFHAEAKEKGLGPLSVTGSLFINHASIVGSLMVSSIVAHLETEDLPGLTAAQILAFLAHYQKELLSVSEEVFFEGLEKRVGIDAKKIVAKIQDSISDAELDVDITDDNNGNPGGMIH